MKGTRYKVAAVSYLNTLPFIFGLQNHDIKSRIDMEVVHPSVCAEKLLGDQVDIGLVPVVVLPEIPKNGSLFDYGIAADGKVRSVILYSRVPIQEVRTITLDYQSRTSINLARILAHNYWKVEVQWIQGRPGFEDQELEHSEAAVVIGDRSFEKPARYEYIYDLADEWKTYSGLPFVFAAWMSNKPIDGDFREGFKEALEYGITHLEDTVNAMGTGQVIDKDDLLEYLKTNIHFRLDDQKKSGMQQFLNELTLLEHE